MSLLSTSFNHAQTGFLRKTQLRYLVHNSPSHEPVEFSPYSHNLYHSYQLYCYTGCPTRYRTRHFFNNFTTNENIAAKFEADLPHCVRNVTTA